MDNPLDNVVTLVRPGMTEDDLRAYCEDFNARKSSFAQSRWLYVREVDDVRRVITLEGIAAEEVRKTLKGWLPDYYNWTQARLDGLAKALMEQARMGMTQETFEKWNGRTKRIAR